MARLAGPAAAVARAASAPGEHREEAAGDPVLAGAEPVGHPASASHMVDRVLVRVRVRLAGKALGVRGHPASFARAGIPRIEQVITDNHFSYKRSNDMRAAITALGARHLFIKPHCPWQNGKVERFNRTLAIEWAHRQIFLTSTERTNALAPWLEHYNTDRRHSALGGRPPISRVQPT